MYFQEIPRRNISIFNCYAIENLIDGKPKSNNPKYVSLLTNRNILFTKKFALLIFSLTKYINRSTICRTHRRTSMKITKQTHKKWKKQKTDITNWAIKTNQFHIFFCLPIRQTWIVHLNWIWLNEMTRDLFYLSSYRWIKRKHFTNEWPVASFNKYIKAIIY